MATQLVVPENLNTQTARLPAAYQAAQTALANCISLDECKTWADKAQALASYARQADDDALEKQAMRIRSRAIRRCGELLQEFKSAGGRPDREETRKPGLTSSPQTQRVAAEAAGLSLHQERIAVRVAAVPANDFEAAIDGTDPPSISALADMGRKPSVQSADVHPKYNVANVQLMSLARRLTELTEQHASEEVATGVADHNRRELQTCVAKLRRWLKAFAPKIRS